MIDLISILIFSLPVSSIESNCDNKENLSQTDLNICSYKVYLTSKKRLSNILENKTLKEWNKVSNQVCREVWKNYKKGSIYSLQVNRCQTKMNDYLFYSNKGGMKGMDERYKLN